MLPTCHLVQQTMALYRPFAPAHTINSSLTLGLSSWLTRATAAWNSIVLTHQLLRVSPSSNTQVRVPLCASTSPSLKLSLASFHKLPLYRVILFISCSAPKASAAPHHSTAATCPSSSSCTWTLLQSSVRTHPAHFVQDAKHSGIAFNESYLW